MSTVAQGGREIKRQETVSSLTETLRPGWQLTRPAGTEEEIWFLSQGYMNKHSLMVGIYLAIMYQSRGPYQIYKAPRAVRPEGFRNLICPRGWYIIVLEYPFKSTSKVLNFVIDLIFKINKLLMT